MERFRGKTGDDLIRDDDGDIVLHADAQATVEALQRERDEAIRHKEIEKALTNEQAGLVGKLQAALDAEREKRTALLAEIDEGLTLSDNLLAIRTVTALYDELAQLQALVRAFFTSEDKWAVAYRELERLGYTPDATTPVCQICNGANGVPGNENIVNGVVMCDYCHAKGGDGE